MENNSPLVSVFIVTYNSQDYIVEALESVKAQTYKNIELIVSDDCSKDRTLELVKRWVKDNAQRFERTEIVEVDHNTGTAANYNRAVKACRGEWLKMLDGDDMLYTDCISVFVKHVNSKIDDKIIFSDYDKLVCNINSRKTYKNCTPRVVKQFSMMKPVDQFMLLLKGNFLLSSTCFIKASILKENSYNEKYPLLEDIPMWLKLTYKGLKISYLDTSTVIYRVANSVTSIPGLLFSPRYFEIRRSFFNEVELPFIIEYQLKDAYNAKMRLFMWYKLCVGVLNNKRNFFTGVVSRLFKIVIWCFCFFKLPATLKT